MSRDTMAEKQSTRLARLGGNLREICPAICCWGCSEAKVGQQELIIFNLDKGRDDHFGGFCLFLLWVYC